MGAIEDAAFTRANIDLTARLGSTVTYDPTDVTVESFDCSVVLWGIQKDLLDLQNIVRDVRPCQILQSVYDSAGLAGPVAGIERRPGDIVTIAAPDGTLEAWTVSGRPKPEFDSGMWTLILERNVRMIT